MLDDEIANDSQDNYADAPNSDVDVGAETETGGNLDEMLTQHVSNDIKEYDVIWILLTLSLLSIGLHVMILLHVRSSAPTYDAMRQKFDEATESEIDHADYIQRGKKRLGYWIYNQYREKDRERNMQDGISVDSSAHSDLESGLSDSSQSQSDNEMDAFLSHDVFRNSDSTRSPGSILDGNDIPRRRRNRGRTNSGVSLRGLVNIHNCFSTGYDGKSFSPYHSKMLQFGFQECSDSACKTIQTLWEKFVRDLQKQSENGHQDWRTSLIACVKMQMKTDQIQRTFFRSSIKTHHLGHFFTCTRMRKCFAIIDLIGHSQKMKV